MAPESKMIAFADELDHSTKTTQTGFPSLEEFGPTEHGQIPHNTFDALQGTPCKQIPCYRYPLSSHPNVQS